MPALYGMSWDQETRYFRLNDRLRSLGYFIASEPLDGLIDEWLDGIERRIPRIEERLAQVNKGYRTRGRSMAARYYLTTNDFFDPGFGIRMTATQRRDNAIYAAKIARGVARWNAAFGEGVAE